MSTKSTIAYGENFHFYHELMDPEPNVYLELEGVHFEASRKQHLRADSGPYLGNYPDN